MLPWQLLAAARLPQAEALALRQRLASVMRGFGYAAWVPFGHAGQGVLLRAAATSPVAPERLAEIEAKFGLGAGRRGVLRHEDPRRGQWRAIGLEHDAPAPGAVDGAPDAPALRQLAFALAGDARAEAWLKASLQQRLPVQALGRPLLGAGAQAPAAFVSTGRQVCSFLDIGETAIAQALAACGGNAAQRLTALQARLRCGTNGGSCLPAIKRLIGPPGTPAPAGPAVGGDPVFLRA